MTIATTRFDPMEVLDTTEDHVELLNDALATGDPGVIVNAIAEIARGRGINELARVSGVGRSTLYKALRDGGNPTLHTIMPVLAALKLRLRASSVGAE